MKQYVLLKLEGVSAHYGLVQALFDVSMTVDEGEIVCLIGPNGAGKTTVIRTITGSVRASSGSIIFQGQPIHGARTSAIIRSGISAVPEGRRVFPQMTVAENLSWRIRPPPREGPHAGDDGDCVRVIPSAEG